MTSKNLWMTFSEYQEFDLHTIKKLTYVDAAKQLNKA